MGKISMPFIRTGVGVKAPRWPFVMNGDSEQAIGLHSWWPVDPSTPGKLIDMSPGPKNDLTLIGEPPLATTLFGGNATRFIANDEARVDGTFTELDAYPLTIVGWTYHQQPNSINLGPWIADKGSGIKFIYISTRQDLGGNPAAIFHHSYGAGTFAFVESVTDLASLRGPFLVAGKFLGTASQHLYLDGILETIDTTSHGAVNGTDRLAIGRWSHGAPRNTGDGFWWDSRIYRRDVPEAVMRQMFEPDTRYELYDEYGQKTYFDMGGPSAPGGASEVVQPMMTIVNQ